MNTEQRFEQLQSIDLANLSGDKDARTIAISSGKSGDGASSVAINLAVELVGLNKTVCLLDVDSNLANHDIYRGLNPAFSLQDVLDGNKLLADVMINGPAGTRILPTDPWLTEWSAYDAAQQQQMIDILEQLEASFDYLLIGPGDGGNETVLSFIEAAPETLIIVTSDPVSIKYGFALLQEMTRRDFDRPIHLVVNRVKSSGVAEFTIQLFSTAVKLFLGLDISSSSHIVEHDNLAGSLSQQVPYDLLYPRTPATRCMRNLAYRLIESRSSHRSTFSEQLAQINAPLQQEDADETALFEQPLDPEPEAIEDSEFADREEMESVFDSGSFEEVEEVIDEEALFAAEPDPPQDKPAKFDDKAGYLSAIHFAGELNRKQSNK